VTKEGLQRLDTRPPMTEVVALVMPQSETSDPCHRSPRASKRKPGAPDGAGDSSKLPRAGITRYCRWLLKQELTGPAHAHRSLGMSAATIATSYRL